MDLTYPTGALGQDANIRQVKVDLPEQLPSRLTTLQKACTAAQFNANPAGCPAPSLIGTARAITPILPVPLEGPAYFVSHGGEAFPDLEIVLQGDGVTIVLTGNTFISKAGITSSTFKTVPDQPVTSFELTLPEGPYSALAANGNLCQLTKTVTVKKKVTIRVKGHRKTETRKVNRRSPRALRCRPRSPAERRRNPPVNPDQRDRLPEAAQGEGRQASQAQQRSESKQLPHRLTERQPRQSSVPGQGGRLGALGVTTLAWVRLVACCYNTRIEQALSCAVPFPGVYAERQGEVSELRARIHVGPETGRAP